MQRDQLGGQGKVPGVQTICPGLCHGELPPRGAAGQCGVAGDQSSLHVASGRRWLTIIASYLQRQLVESRRRCGKWRGTGWRARGLAFS